MTATHADRLARRTLELVDIPSESLHEAAILAWVAARIPDGWSVRHEPGEWVVAHRGDDGPGLVLAGHVDTVPAQGNLPGHLADGAVRGLGASDMKGGVAVMLEVADWLAGEAEGVDRPVTLVFFAREELPVALSPVSAILAEEPRIRQAELVVMLEPTDCGVEVGCLGNIIATVEFDGVACHSARPWQGASAVDAALPTLARVAGRKPVEVNVEGHTFTEVVSVVGFEAGVADNVIPGVARGRINYRYAPGRAPEEAEAELRELLSGATRTEIVSHAQSAAVPRANRLLDALVATTGQAPRPKIAWTPVAEFAAAGLDAVNFGPGSPATAHRADEWIAVAALDACFRALTTVIAQA